MRRDHGPRNDGGSDGSSRAPCKETIVLTVNPAIEILDLVRRVFNVAQRMAFKSAYLAYRAAYNSLSSLALQRNVCRWPCRPKQHLFEHLVFEWMPFNGRYFHNYLNEDAIRRVKGLASRSHPAYMSRHVLLKYSIQQALAWR